MKWSVRDFDPVRLGNAETDAWVYYYLRRWGPFLRASFTMVRVGFGLSWPDTLRGAWWVMRANQAWAPFPDNDPDTARAYMRRFYTLVARRGRESFDVDEAARLEVEWWRVHRALQHEGLPLDSLVDAVAALYAHVYGVPAAAVREAAEGRADGMVISDKWVADGTDPGSPAIAEERAALVRGYTALREAVRLPGPDLRPDGPS
jgi:hypothetical protein